MNPFTTKTNPYQGGIDIQAERIKKQIEGGMLFGYPVDMKNINQVIYAAYLIGELNNTPSWIKKDT